MQRASRRRKSVGRLCVQAEPRRQGGLAARGHSGRLGPVLEVYRLAAAQVHGQAFDGVRFPMQGERQQAPTSFWRPHVPSVEEVLDFVAVEFQGGPVVPFVHVLEKVLDATDAATVLHVEVAPQFSGQVRVVRHNVSGVDLHSILHRRRRRLPSSVHWVPVSVHVCGLGELPRAPLGARPLLHARSARIAAAARTVDLGSQYDSQ
eukprot:3296830-Pyramimonas_sp.AAC.4